MLNYYKGQQVVERGFPFLKRQKLPRIGIFSQERRTHRGLGNNYGPLPIDLFVCRVEASKKAKEAGQSVPNQLKKPNQKPNMRWIIQLFMRVN
jgi:transposase